MAVFCCISLVAPRVRALMAFLTSLQAVVGVNKISVTLLTCSVRNSSPISSQPSKTSSIRGNLILRSRASVSRACTGMDATSHREEGVSCPARTALLPCAAAVTRGAFTVAKAFGANHITIFYICFIYLSIVTIPLHLGFDVGDEVAELGRLLELEVGRGEVHLGRKVADN